MTFRELCNNKPSRALQAMLDGLEEMGNRPDFIIDMRTYGNVVNDICCGCAATCAVQKLSGYKYTVKDLQSGMYSDRREALGLPDDLAQFEYVINAFRCGDARYLMTYFQAPHFVTELLGENFRMESDNYRDHFPKVREIIAFLESKGL